MRRWKKHTCFSLETAHFPLIHFELTQNFRLLIHSLEQNYTSLELLSLQEIHKK